MTKAIALTWRRVAAGVVIGLVAASCSAKVAGTVEVPAPVTAPAVAVAPVSVGRVTGTITAGFRPGTMPRGNTDPYLPCAAPGCSIQIEVRNSEDEKSGVVPSGDYSLDLAPGVYTLVIPGGPFEIRSEPFTVIVGETTHFDTTLVVVYP